MRSTDLCVQNTLDYNIIKHIGGNRIVNPKNVEALQKSMSEKQLIVPAIVNEYMEIIDGQHRLAACKLLGIPFYYIVVSGYRLEDVQRINANMSNWTVYDFLDSFIDLYKDGNVEYAPYVELRDFIDKTGLPLPTSLILSDLSDVKDNIVDRFKNGKFKFKNKMVAEEIAEALKDFEPYDHIKWKQYTFALMFAKIYLHDTYSHDIMLRNLPKQSNLLSLMGNRKSTLTYLIDIYNFKTPRNKRLYANVIEDAWEDMLKLKED